MIVPKKLKTGDNIRVIAPATSMAKITKENQIYAEEVLKNLGLNITYGKNINESDMFYSSSIKSRIEDLHDAFLDPKVNGVFAVTGGSNSNQLLKYIDYDLIKRNPKIFCGFSDITALQSAIYKKTGLITYSGPAFSSFAMKKGNEYSLEYFKKAFFNNESILIKPSKEWSDDVWYKDQENRNFIKNDGYWVFNEGKAEGKIIGGNLGTLRLLYGTEFMPSIENSILFIEDDAYTIGCDDVEFDRNLQSLIHQSNFNTVKVLIIGRFQKDSEMTYKKLEYIIKTKKELENIPVIANLDFGHTAPIFTFPIGGEAFIDINKKKVSIEIKG